MAFMRNINDFILTLVALSLPSIAASIDCNGKPFHCMNSTHFMICVDFGSGVSITMDDFVIPCPPTTVCQANNRFECEFTPVTTTTVAPVVTNSPLTATVSNDIVIDSVSDVTTIPFEEYYNTISTTTLSEGNLITRDVITTKPPVNNISESEVSVAATDSNINEIDITVGVSPNYFSTLATLDIVTDEATVTEVIPNVVENINVIYESDLNIDGALPNATETVPTDITHINLSDNNIVDVTVNYEFNSTLLETIIGATNLLQFNTPPYNSSFNIVTEPILSETTESIISKPTDDKHVYLTTLEASPDLVFDENSLENVTESITTKTTEHKNLIQSQSNSTLNKTTSTGDIIQNDTTTLNTALNTNGFASNVDKSEKQIKIAEPILFEENENTTVSPVDVFLYNQTRDNATEPPPTGYKNVIQSQSNQFNNKPLYNSTSYDVTEPILSEATESITNIYNKQVSLTTLDASPVVGLDEKTIENVPESIPISTTELRDLIESQSNSTLDENILTGDIVQSNPTTLNTALDTYGFALNVNNSDLSYNEVTTKYEKQISTAGPILFEAKENTTYIPVDDKQAYLTTLDASPDVFLDNQTKDNATESIAVGPTEYKHLIEFQNNLLDNKSHYDSTTYDVTEPILPESKESIISKPIDDKQVYLTTLDSLPDAILDDKSLENVTESMPTNTKEYKDIKQSQSNSTFNEAKSTDDIGQNYPNSLTTTLDTNGFAFNANNSHLSFHENTTKYEQISTAEPALIQLKETELDDKKAYMTTLDASPDVFLNNKFIDTVTESIPTETLEYRHSLESQSNSTLNASMSSGDIEQSYTTPVNTVLNINGYGFNAYNSNLSLNEDTAPYYEEQISTAQNNFELLGNTDNNITQPGTEMANITTIATTTVTTEPVSTNTPNAPSNTDAAQEVTVKLNVIKSENITNIFGDMQTTDLSLKVANHYLTSTEDSFTSTSDNKYEKLESNTNTTQSENLTSFYYVQNVTKPETETEEIHMVLPKPPRFNETTTIVYRNSSSADNTSTTYTIPNIHTTIAQNRTQLHENSARTDETQKVITSTVNVNDKTADATENNNLLQPVTEPLSTPPSNIAHNVVGSDFTNDNLQDTFIKRIELTAGSFVTNETLTQNVIDNDTNNNTEITANPSNQIVLKDRVIVLKADDKIHTVDISKSTTNDISETTTQEIVSFTYSNVHYLTDIEEISHDQGVSRNNIISSDTIQSTSSILALTTESPKEPHSDAVLQTITSFHSVSDKVYTAESDTYLTRSTTSSQSDATPSTAFDSINSDKQVTRENEAENISTASLKLEITSAINENSYIAAKKNIPPTDITNSPQQTSITFNTAFENTNDAVKQVTRQIVDENISTDSSILQISFPKTAFVVTELNIPSTEGNPEPVDLIPVRFKYTTTTETTNDSVHQESRITIASDFSTTKPSESSALSAQHNRENIKETLIAASTSNIATDLTAIPNLSVSNLSGADVMNFGEEINAISKASTDNVIEKYPITIKKEVINPENIRNSIKTITATEDITATEESKRTEPSRSYSIRRQNIDKLEITSVVTDETAINSFIAGDVNYTENQNKLADSHRLLSNAQAEPNIRKILPERIGANIDDPNAPVNKTTVIDGITSMNTADAADTKLTQDEINQQSTIKFATLKFSTTETLLNEAFNEKDVMPVVPEQKTFNVKNSEPIVKTKESNGEINANPIITTDSSSFESHTERKLSFTTSIEESKYQSNLASNTEPWRAIAVTEPVVYPTQPYTETLITSSKPYTKSNDQMSEDVTSVTPKLNLANPSEKQYINLPQNMEPATKNVLTSSEPSVIFLQDTEPSGIPNQDVQSSSVLKFTTQKSHGVDSLKLVQNQRVLFTENNSINVTIPVSPSAITESDVTTRQPFTESNTQILPKLYVFNGEQIVPTTEKLKVNVTPIISPSVGGNKSLVDVVAVPIVKSNNNNVLNDVISNAQAHLITVYNSNRSVESELKPEFNKVQLNITSTTEKTVAQSSDLDIVMIDVVKADSPHLGEIATGSNTHSGISAIQKSTSQQVKKRKAIKNVTEVEHETEKEEKPEVAKTSPLIGKFEHVTSTEGIPFKKQANVQRIPPINTKQNPVQNVTTRIRSVGSHVVNTTAGFNTKLKSPVANTHNSTLPASRTSKHNFVCKSNSRGRFSDNGDCRKFYICIGKHEPIKGICPNNTVFSELRKQCTKNMSHCVRNNQFQCVSEGRFSDYLYNNIYYICVNNKAHTSRFIRFKLQCQNGYHLNKTPVRCVLNTESIQSTSQQSQQSKSAGEVSTSNQSISAKSEKIKDEVKTNKKFECKRSGKFPEPNDCRNYYVCTKLGKSEYRQRNKKCDSDEVYNRDKKKCVDAESYECS